jgi:hypothetical protein
VDSEGRTLWIIVYEFLYRIDDAYHIREVLLASANDACESSPGDLFDNLNVLATLTTAKALGIIQV